MRGIDSKTGKALDGLAHLRQSIRDILTTPLGSRVMRRTYGSRLFELVDAPLNGSTVADIYAATAEALATWEPRLKLRRVQVESHKPGSITLSVIGTLAINGEVVALEGITIS